MRRAATIVLATALGLALVVGIGSTAQAATPPTVTLHSDATWTLQPSGTGTSNITAKLAASSASVPAGLALLDQNPGMSTTFGSPSLWKSSSGKSFESGLYLLAYPLGSNAFPTAMSAQLTGITEQLQAGSEYVEVFNQDWQLQDTEAQLFFGAMASDGRTPSVYLVKGTQYKYRYETFANGIPQLAPQFMNDLQPGSKNGSVGCEAMTDFKIAFDVTVPLIKYALNFAGVPKPILVIAEMALEAIKDALTLGVKSACST